MKLSIFSTFSLDPVTLTFEQGYHGRCAFKGNITCYLLVKYDVSAINNIQDISDFNEIAHFSHFSMDPMTLTFNEAQKVIKICMTLKVHVLSNIIL